MVECTPKLTHGKFQWILITSYQDYYISTLLHNSLWLGQSTVQEMMLDSHWNRIVLITRQQISPLERRALHATDNSAPILWSSVWRKLLPYRKYSEKLLLTEQATWLSCVETILPFTEILFSKILARGLSSREQLDSSIKLTHSTRRQTPIRGPSAHESLIARTDKELTLPPVPFKMLPLY